MDTLMRDVTHAARLLTRHRGFAAAALITIALGVGGSSAVFSVVYGVLLRPLPYHEPERLVRLWEVHPGANAPLTGALLSTPTYHAWMRAARDARSGMRDEVSSRGADASVGGADRRMNTNVAAGADRVDATRAQADSGGARSLEAIGAFRVSDYTLTRAAGDAGGGADANAGSDTGVGSDAAADTEARRIRGTRVTPSVLRLLHVSPFAGRFFDDADGEPGAEPVVVISHALWRERFAGGSASGVDGGTSNSSNSGNSSNRSSRGSNSGASGDSGSAGSGGAGGRDAVGSGSAGGNGINRSSSSSSSDSSSNSSDRSGANDRERGDSRAAAAIGAQITLDGVPHRIVGIAPPGFSFPGRTQGWSDGPRDVALYTPLVIPAANSNATVIGVVNAIARLAPGVTVAQAEAEGTALARHVDRPNAELVFGAGGPVDVRVRSVADQMTMAVRPALMMLTAAIALVLLIACANVANLLLSRGADRTREIAVRAALGASRRRLVRQLVTESLVVSLIGGLLGTFVGWALTTAVPALAPTSFPRIDDVHVDAWFLIIALLTTIVVGAVSGLLPASRIARVDLASTMTAGGPRTIGIGAPGARLRRLLLVVEAALAVVLLVGAALLARSFVALLHVDAGYDARDVLTADIHVTRTPTPLTPTPPRTATPPTTTTTAAATTDAANRASASRAAAALAATTLERLRAIPGVRAVGAGTMAPFGGVLNSSGFALPGMTTADGRPVTARALQSVITPGYAEALGLRLKAGRFFRADDVSSPVIAMLVNETFAKTYFADRSAGPIVGRRFTGMFPRILGRTDALVIIVGVVGDMLPSDVDARPQPQIYVPPGTGFDGGFSTLVVKTKDAGDAARIAPLVTRLVQQTYPGAAVDRIGPLTDKISASLGEPRFAMFVLVAFAALALTLATTGLYGVLSHAVAQRRREMGVRAALGATRRDLLTMVLREGLVITAIGLVLGLIAAALATRALATLLFGVTTTDAVAFVSAPLLLLIVASAACLIPARRAATIDPADALRAD